MKRLFLALALAACTGVPNAAAQEDKSLQWMSGCWQTADKSYREIWTKPQYGYLFGHSFTFENEGVSFFEQSRIDPGQPAVYNAYPAGFGPSAFTEDQRGDKSISFSNPAHDFPQRITYVRKGGKMTATISKADGSAAQVLAFKRC